MSETTGSPEMDQWRDELVKTVAAKQRNVLRQLWIIAGVLITMLVAVGVIALWFIPGPPPTAVTAATATAPQAAPGKDGADFLTLFVPIFALAFGFVIGFLGLKRLETFDTEISNARRHLENTQLEERRMASAERQRFQAEIERRTRELRDEQNGQMDAVREQANREQARAKADVTQQVQQFRENLSVLADQEIADKLDQRREQIDDGLSEFVKRTDGLIERIGTDLEPYKWLEERKGEVDYLIGIHTVGVAHDRASDFFAKDQTDIAIRIADRAAQSKLPGSAADYHNLASELARRDQCPLAVRIVENGLDRFPDDVDLLADATRFSLSNGDLGAAEESYNRLANIDSGQWSWRPFVFAGDYLEAVGRIDEAMALYERFRELIPEDERGYSQPGLFYQRRGRYQTAIRYLEDGVAKCARASQCALALCETYTEIGEYEKAVEVADRALEATAESQPSVNLSAIIWHRAAASESILHRILRKRTSEDPSWRTDQEMLELARGCVIDYRTAMELRDSLTAYRYRGPQRILILHRLLMKHGAPEDYLEEVFGEQPGQEADVAALAKLLALRREMESQSDDQVSSPE